MKQLTITAREYLAMRQKPQRRPYVSRSKRSERSFGSIIFDSKAELERYQELLVLKMAGAVKRIVLQPAFDLGGVLYKADFEVFWSDGQGVTYEDVKPSRAPADVMRRFRRNQQQVKTMHGVEVYLVEST